MAGESHPIAKLAMEAIEVYVRTGEVMEPPPELGDELRKRAGAFVSIKKNVSLRGCIGTISPTKENLACEIIQNAISAATSDPRFTAVSVDELDQLRVSVDVLSESVKVLSIEELNPRKYGVIVSSGHKRGLLLPDLEGVNTPEEQIAISKRKAGISGDEEVELKKFEVHRYK